MTWKRKSLEKIIENYHFRFNQLLSILEKKSRSVLDALDTVDKNMLSVAAEADVSRFLDFLKEQKTVLKANQEKEDELLELYFPR